MIRHIEALLVTVQVVFRPARVSKRKVASQRVRPALEGLEERYVPAYLIWIGQNAGDKWSIATNWINKATNVKQAPVNGDTLWLDPAQKSADGTKGSALQSVDDMAGLNPQRIIVNPGYAGIDLQKVLQLGTVGTGGISSILDGTISSSNNQGAIEVNSDGVLNWFGGTLEVPLNVDAKAKGGTAAGNVNVDLNAQYMDALNNSGKVIMAPTLNNDITANATWFNNAGASFDIQANHDLLGTGQIHNKGLFKKTGGGNSQIEKFFSNDDTTATLEVDAGDLIFKGSAEQYKGTTKLVGTTTLLTVIGAYTVDDGTLLGGTISGDLIVKGGDIYPGGDGTIGNLTLLGNYTQSGGTLHIDVDPKATAKTDQVIVANPASVGSVTLQNAGQNAGTLTVNFLNPPNSKDQFNIIEYRLLVGDFATFNPAGKYTVNKGVPVVGTNYFYYQIQAVVGGSPLPSASRSATSPAAAGTTANAAWLRIPEATSFTPAGMSQIQSAAVRPDTRAVAAVFTSGPLDRERAEDSLASGTFAPRAADGSSEEVLASALELVSPEFWPAA
jgi:hypothetical protein